MNIHENEKCFALNIHENKKCLFLIPHENEKSCMTYSAKYDDTEWSLINFQQIVDKFLLTIIGKCGI